MDFENLTAEEVFSMPDDEFLAAWDRYVGEDRLDLQETLNQKEEWL